jgi:GDP-D-mannose dehydratase
MTSRTPSCAAANVFAPKSFRASFTHLELGSLGGAGRRPGTLRLLRQSAFSPSSRRRASIRRQTSELYGEVSAVRQNERTLLYPRLPYAAELLFVDDFADPTAYHVRR